MDTLRKRFQNTDRSGHSISRMNPEEIADTLFCLCNAVEEGTLIQAAPENITIKEDGTVSVSQETGLNIYYAAPEIGEEECGQELWLVYAWTACIFCDLWPLILRG